MELNYSKHESTIKPLEVDTTSSPNFVYLTKNIREEIRKDEVRGTEAKFFVYDESKVTKDEYIQMLTEKNAELEQAALDNAEMILDIQTAQLGGNA